MSLDDFTLLFFKSSKEASDALVRSVWMLLTSLLEQRDARLGELGDDGTSFDDGEEIGLLRKKRKEKGIFYVRDRALSFTFHSVLETRRKKKKLFRLRSFFCAESKATRGNLSSLFSYLSLERFSA